MRTSLNDSYLLDLIHFYNKVEKVIDDERIRIIKGSIFITLIKLPVNRVSKVLKESALSTQAFLESNLRELLTLGYICESNEVGQDTFNITALGIWTVETQKNKIEVMKLISFFQETKFSKDVSNRPLTDQEKIILLSMVAIRNFDSKSAMNLQDRKRNDYWIVIFNQISSHLFEKRLIRSNEWIPNQAGVEHPVSYILRRAQDLPQKTRHIYQNERDYRYYLNICQDVENANGKLRTLISLIYKQIASKKEIKEILSFLNDIAYNQGAIVSESLEYINPDWDSILEEALLDFYFDQ